MSVKLSLSEFDQPDKTDYLVAAACGVLTGILDSLWVGKFSLRDAQEWGRTNINGFVIKVAQSRGYKKDSLEGAIKYLEDKAPMVTDSLTNEWGGGYYHHFRDFSHHASIIGLVFSLITQFTGISYGTDVDGIFRGIEVKNTELIGETFEDKLYKGIVMWALHLVSDMAGSQNNPGAGTGIPGPILSLLKGLSTFPCIKAIKINYKDKEIGVSTMLSKIFHGTIFEHTSTKDLIHFDLRTELGIYSFDVKQKVPVVLNQCAIRAFYFLRRFVMELDYIHYKSIEDIKNINAHHILPYKNKCITRMSTISSGVFCAVDAGDAAIRTLLSKPDTKRELMTGVLLKINFSGLCNFAIAIKNDILFNVKGQTTPKDKLNETIGGAGSEVAASYDLTIDVSAQIDNTDLYRFAFRQMYNCELPCFLTLELLKPLIFKGFMFKMHQNIES
ncbi:MAG: hypothetical protein K6G63_04230 [Eubacterium sp.]|nr:hypothetical protein [Eubacterium sp.]